MSEKKHIKSVSNIDMNFILEYYKIEKKRKNCLIKENEVQYGIEIIKKTKKDEDVSEISMISNITKDEEEINNLLEILSKNNVTPVSLEYIIEDLYSPMVNI